MIGSIPHTTYSQFLIYLIIAVTIYQGVRILRRLTWSTMLSESNALVVKEVLSNFLLIYEPLVLVLLLSLLITVSVYKLLPLVVILLFISYKHWKNFISRSIVLIGGKLKPNMHIISDNVEGKLIRLGRLSVDIQTQQGIHNTSYQSLLDNGYTLSEGDKISRLYVLDMIKPEGNTKPEIDLLDRLANTPYIDWSTQPDIEVKGIDKEQVSLKLVLRDKSHLDEMLSLLHAWKYTSINVQN